MFINLKGAVDYGGPRKEFFMFSLIEIKQKYFDNGLRELLAEHYLLVGRLIGMYPICMFKVLPV